MVQIGQNYNPNEHEPNQGSFDPMPAGWYAMHIIDSQVRKTRDGQGQFLELTWEILEQYHPDLKGRRAWDRLNLWNNNQKAVDIANGTLSQICRSIGQLEQWSDTNVLHNRPAAVKLKVRAATEQYEATNEVSGYDAVASRFQVGAPVNVQTAAPPPAAPPTGTPAPVGHQPAPPPQGQPGQVQTPPWQQK
jgi:hypothetical protein